MCFLVPIGYIHDTNNLPFISKPVQDVRCKNISTAYGIKFTIGCSPHPHGVAAVAFRHDGRAAAVKGVGYVVYEHTSQIYFISHQISMYASCPGALHMCAEKIETIPGTDERAGDSVVVTAGVG